MFVPLADEEKDTVGKNRVAAAANSWAKRHGRQFSIRIVESDGKLGVGVWRTE